MPRSRNIKHGLFKNELLGEADPVMSLAFIGLWTLADKEGRLEDRPKRIKAELFPYRDDVKIDEILSWLMDNSFIARYCVMHEPSIRFLLGPCLDQARAKHESYIQVLNWEKHQRPHHKEKLSEIPALIIDESCMSHEQAMHESTTSGIYRDNPPDTFSTDTLATLGPSQGLNDAGSYEDMVGVEGGES